MRRVHDIKTNHSMLRGVWIKLIKLSTGPLQGERAGGRVSEYVLFEVLDGGP